MRPRSICSCTKRFPSISTAGQTQLLPKCNVKTRARWLAQTRQAARCSSGETPHARSRAWQESSGKNRGPKTKANAPLETDWCDLHWHTSKHKSPRVWGGVGGEGWSPSFPILHHEPFSIKTSPGTTWARAAWPICPLRFPATTERHVAAQRARGQSRPAPLGV